MHRRLPDAGLFTLFTVLLTVLVFLSHRALRFAALGNNPCLMCGRERRVLPSVLQMRSAVCLPVRGSFTSFGRAELVANLALNDGEGAETEQARVTGADSTFTVPASGSEGNGRRPNTHEIFIAICHNPT